MSIYGYSLVFGVMVSFGLIHADDWVTNAALIQKTIDSLTTTLNEDAVFFDSITQEVDQLVDLINQQDAAEQIVIKTLSAQFAAIVAAYKDTLNQEQDAYYQNAYAIQQLKITLASTQVAVQDAIDQLTVQYKNAEALLQQLTDEYKYSVQDNQQEAADLLALLRSVCDAYTVMITEKAECVDQLNGIVTALNNHINNAGNGLYELNQVIQ